MDTTFCKSASNSFYPLSRSNKLQNPNCRRRSTNLPAAATRDYCMHMLYKYLSSEVIARRDSDMSECMWGTDDQVFPLHTASCHGHANVVRLLLASGANVDLADVDGKTALFSASQKGHVSVAELFLEHGADVNLVGNDPVMFDWPGSPSHIDLESNCGATPLYIASKELDVKGESILNAFRRSCCVLGSGGTLLSWCTVFECHTTASLERLIDGSI